MRPKELRAFDADGPVTQGSPLGRTVNDADMLRHDSCVLCPK